MPSDGMASGHITLDLQTQLEECYKKRIVIHEPICDKKNHVVKVINLLINHGGVTSTNTMCQVFFSVLPHYFAMYIAFRVALPRFSWGGCGELSFGFPSGAVAFEPNIVWYTPPIHQH